MFTHGLVVLISRRGIANNDAYATRGIAFQGRCHGTSKFVTLVTAMGLGLLRG